MLFVMLSVIAFLLTARSPSRAARVRLNEADSGRTLELHLADRLDVVLEGNPTTGYRWELVTVDKSILKPTGASGKPDYKPDSSALGAGGKFTFTFEAATAGQTKLQLIYHRSFEKGVPPVKTFEATVVVR